MVFLFGERQRKEGRKEGKEGGRREGMKARRKEGRKEGERKKKRLFYKKNHESYKLFYCVILALTIKF